MTTLIIHPSPDIQQLKAFQLASTFLNMQPERQLLQNNPDLHLVDGSLSSSIGIDAVRTLVREMQFHPYQSQYQVGLILFAHLLTEEAQNSLLKTLEEPGDMTRFILTSPHERFLLPTIRSRCNCIFVKESTVINSMPETNTSIDEILGRDLVDKFLYIEEITANEKEHPGTVADFLAGITNVFRDRMIQSARSGNQEEVRKNKTALKLISRAQQFIKRNTNKRITLENLLLQLEIRIMGTR